MSALTDVRDDLSTAITSAVGSGVAVFTTIPERVKAPFVAVAPGDPYIEYDGAAFGGKRVRLSATIVVAPGTNDKQAAALDDLILAVVDAIDATGEFIVERVFQPGQVAINNQAHLGASVSVLTEV